MRPVSPDLLIVRNKKIIELFHQGMGVSTIGPKVRLSRERVCQIIYKVTGLSPTEHRIRAKLAANESSKDSSARSCKQCGRKFYPGKYQHKYCSDVCREIFHVVHQRDLKVTKVCFHCSKNYHPFQSRRPTKRNFCSMRCYGKEGGLNA